MPKASLSNSPPHKARVYHKRQKATKPFATAVGLGDIKTWARTFEEINTSSQ
jgi:hypothetical protein